MTKTPQFDDDLRREVGEFLQSCRTASLATVDGEGRPCAANVQYVSDEMWWIYFVSSPKSVHAENMFANEHVAMTIYDKVDDFRQIHGLQLRGRCAAVEGGEQWQRAFKLFAGKYPFVATVAAIRERFDAEQFYCLRPHWVRWIDNRRRFGFKVEMEM